MRPLHHNLVFGNVDLRVPRQQVTHAVRDVMRHEGLAVVLADTRADGDPGFAPQEAEELTGVVVLDQDRLVRLRQDLAHCLRVERDEPLDRELVGGDSCLCQLFVIFSNKGAILARIQVAVLP